MMVGPTKPPRLPIELISAMPAAAERPPSSCGGMAQKTAASDRNPTWAMVKPKTRIHGNGCDATATSRPSAVTAAHAATHPRLVALALDRRERVGAALADVRARRRAREQRALVGRQDVAREGERSGFVARVVGDRVAAERRGAAVEGRSGAGDARSVGAGGAAARTIRVLPDADAAARATAAATSSPAAFC